MILRTISFALVCAISLTLMTLQATSAEEMRWPDLGVPIHPSEDPFYGLKLAHKNSLRVLLRAAATRSKAGALDEALAAQEAEARKSLRDAGLDSDALIARDRQFRNKIKAQRRLVRSELDGREIRIPGYLLPLELDGTTVTEFLLVPYAGACIHTPPPPANQIIHVTTAQGFVAQGLFTPVWVTGRLSAKSSKQTVGLSDGQSGFDVGYALRATSVKRYE